MPEPTEERVMAELIRDEPDYAKDIPAVTLHGIQQYVASGRPGGHFLQCLLSNDLFGVAAHADAENWAALNDIIKYINNHIPSECYGTPLHYASWMDQKRKARGEVPRMATGGHTGDSTAEGR